VASAVVVVTDAEMGSHACIAAEILDHPVYSLNDRDVCVAAVHAMLALADAVRSLTNNRESGS
jgi:hypothetical protein